MFKLEQEYFSLSEKISLSRKHGWKQGLVVGLYLL